MSPPIIYFAGVNQTHFCESFAGLHVLESFADVRPVVDRYRPTFASMILDSGAFTEMTTGRPIDLNAYTRFCLEKSRVYRWVASLDSIRGGAEANVRNWEAMLAAGVQAVPTFHEGEPWSLLEDYARAAPRIAIGVQRPNGQINHKAVPAFLDGVFSRIPSATRVHGWGLTSYTAWPFESVDSTTWLWELKSLMRANPNHQGGPVLRCLTTGELLRLVQLKYERHGRMAAWAAEMYEEPDAVLCRLLHLAEDAPLGDEP